MAQENTARHAPEQQRFRIHEQKENREQDSVAEEGKQQPLVVRGFPAAGVTATSLA